MKTAIVDLGLRGALKTNRNPIVAFIDDNSISLHCGENAICGVSGDGVGSRADAEIKRLVNLDSFRKAMIAQ